MTRHLLLAACLALAACGAAPPPAGDAPAAAGASSDGTGTKSEATELRDAMQAPLDKARDAEDAQTARDAEREQALGEAGG